MAYDTLHGNGRLKVTEIGPSFGTKLLYFAGFDRTSGPQEPLILDRYVAQALTWLCGFDWPTQQGGWSVKQYATYLSLAHAWQMSGALALMSPNDRYSRSAERAGWPWLSSAGCPSARS